MFRILSIVISLVSTMAWAQSNDPQIQKCFDKMKASGFKSTNSSQSAVTQIDNDLHITGRITQDTLSQFRGMNFKGIKKVVLHSLGGDMEVARQIAEEIERRGWDTEIPENGLCGSACTGIFQAGRRRHMHSTSFLMYHNASVEVLPNSSPIGKLVNGMASQVATGMGIDYLEKHGLSTQLRKDIQNTPAQSFHCIDSVEARGYNAATDLAGGPHVPGPAAGKGMLDEVPDSDGRTWTVPQVGQAYSSSTR